ncbi:co-chaperone GroES [Cohnella soli]|uniref:Co-chaperonin GroES n=1 Tax=Cohnella soli TaxID=425005 RepID=A0ABW0I1X6_9BACL
MIQPIGDRVLVQPTEKEEQTAGGIVLPGTVKEKPQEGRVVAVGAGIFRDGHRVQPEVKVGNQVLFAKFSGTEVKVDGQDMLILHESDLLAILN